MRRILIPERREYIRMKTLRDVEIGGTAKVKKLHGEGAIKKRIMDMGPADSEPIRYGTARAS